MNLTELFLIGLVALAVYVELGYLLLPWEIARDERFNPILWPYFYFFFRLFEALDAALPTVVDVLQDENGRSPR